MAKIKIFDVAELQWSTGRQRSHGAPPEGVSDAVLDSALAMHEEGSDKTPQLVELDYKPGVDVAVHCHDEDEILYIIEGEMHLGTRVLKRGSSLYIPGGAFYGFKAGPEGLRFANFRPRADGSYYPKK